MHRQGLLTQLKHMSGFTEVLLSISGIISLARQGFNIPSQKSGHAQFCLLLLLLILTRFGAFIYQNQVLHRFHYGLGFNLTIHLQLDFRENQQKKLLMQMKAKPEY